MMSHECDTCGETFTTLSRLRLHECPATATESRDPLSSFDGYLDTLSDAIEAEGFHERLPEDWMFSDLEM